MDNLETLLKENYRVHRSTVYTQAGNVVSKLLNPLLDTESLPREIRLVRDQVHLTDYTVYTSKNGEVIPLENDFKSMEQSGLGRLAGVVQQILTLTEPKPQDIRLIREPNKRLYGIYVKEF
jgi:hypothetical protein